MDCQSFSVSITSDQSLRRCPLDVIIEKHFSLFTTPRQSAAAVPKKKKEVNGHFIANHQNQTIKSSTVTGHWTRTVQFAN